MIPSGSTSGVVMLGILKHLMENDYFQIENIESIHASSVGTILSVILCLDFDWETVWSDYDLGNVVDWDTIPWGDIIDLNI